MSSAKLMRKIGAPRFDPMPPGQHGFFLNESETDVNRFVAWVWDGTIAINHPTAGFAPRSPWVVDKDGKAQHIEDAAEHFGWDPAYARRILRQAKSQGRVKTDQYRRILLCGTVVPVLVEDDEEEPISKGEEKKKEKDCTRYVPPYILLEIKNRPKSEIKRILAEEAVAADLHDRRVADALAALRAIREQEQDTRFREHRLPSRRKIEASKQKRQQELPLTVEIKIVDLDLVQSSADEGTAQGRKPDVVQSIHPLLLRDSSIETTTTASPEVADGSPEPLVVVVHELQRYGSATAQAAAKLATDCRTHFPDATPGEIVETIQALAGGITKRTLNPVGMLLSEVPKRFKDYKRKPAPQETGPKCWKCEQPIGTGGSINGMCFDCVEARELASTAGGDA
jgi:hypothetical protein